jgi:hypothetical protein
MGSLYLHRLLINNINARRVHISFAVMLPTHLTLNVLGGGDIAPRISALLDIANGLIHIFLCNVLI